MSWTIHQGDALEVLRGLPAGHFDAVLCDPPYGIAFMGKEWDHGVPSAEVWVEVLRVVKPGAFVLAFGGTRTFHRLACAMEDAGLEIRDCLSWLYGSGFPKSLDISKALDKAAGHVRPRIAGGCGTAGTISTVGLKPGEAISPEAITWAGYGTALKPAWEPCIVTMRPCEGTFAENAVRHGVAGINVDAGRIGTKDGTPAYSYPNGAGGTRFKFDPTPNRQDPVEGSVAGRWPANLILDAEAGAMLDAQSGELGRSFFAGGGPRVNAVYGADSRPREAAGFGDSGGASRFFYCAKASRGEREAGLREASREDVTGRTPDSAGAKHARAGITAQGIIRNTHPCLKPIDLCRYLASLILPPRRDTPRRVLVPFSGTGSEMIGALLAGWDEAVGIEREADYCAIAEARISYWTGEGAPLVHPDDPEEWGPLFDGIGA